MDHYAPVRLAGQLDTNWAMKVRVSISSRAEARKNQRPNGYCAFLGFTFVRVAG
jgi:hypothetical protein